MGPIIKQLMQEPIDNKFEQSYNVSSKLTYCVRSFELKEHKQVTKQQTERTRIKFEQLRFHLKTK